MVFLLLMMGFLRMFFSTLLEASVCKLLVVFTGSDSTGFLLRLKVILLLLLAVSGSFTRVGGVTRIRF